MKKQVLLFCFLSFISLSLCAQGTIAKIKFEEAEEAYSNGQYEAAISKLDEVDKLVGSTGSRTMYLRILAQSKMMEQNSIFPYELLESLRNNCNNFMSKYESNEGVEDKVRDVYKISERLKVYPDTKAGFEKYRADTGMLIKSGFKFSDTNYEMCIINGQNGKCKVESFVGAEISSDSYAHTPSKINKSEYRGGECNGGYLNGLVLMTVSGDNKAHRQNVLAYFVNGKMAYPVLNIYIDVEDLLMIGIEEGNSSYGCLNIGNWDNIDKRPMCKIMQEVYGEQIFTSEFVNNFKKGNVNLNELERKFKEFIASGKKITWE